MLIALTVLAACSDATAPQSSSSLVALSQASSTGGGSGGSGGGGGGGGGARPCTLLSFAILNNVVTGTVVPSFWSPNSAYVAIASVASSLAIAGALPLANAESGTTASFALKFDDTTFGIFDAFANDTDVRRT